ncbi:Putative nuclease (RecB family) [Gloeomargarita lithophora Alchichica-D10]|uniref:Nuclease (RecB family) n=1 Tax=Gloeomargarita lithophora Alchichica-D10 TaxID=1188229 RepID=A0A1J0AD36_9CYAN|nr:TM0106 family RecB-like putative nuclease [Gloeomargarita lithophora]APB33823.1 Putative nuclease (RecB family) [Gloeomargarita lithophora Alchichica-D10]
MSAKPVLVTEHLFYYHRCSRRSFLDHRQAVVPQPERSRHREQVTSRWPGQCPHYQPPDWDTGFQATCEMMRQGVPAIHQGVLQVITPAAVLVGRPDLLIREPGTSRWGDWHYRPLEIRLGQRPKPEYQAVAAFHSWLLAQMQEVWPRWGELALPGPRFLRVNLEQALPPMHQMLAACLDTLKQKDAPEVFISRSRCQLCPWLDYCSTVAKQKHHLSLVPGVTLKRYEELQNLGFNRIDDLAQADPLLIYNRTSLGVNTSNKLVRQAQAIAQQKALAVAPISRLPQAQVGYFFDIEADPYLDCVYLHGVLLVTPQEQKFYSLVAEQVSQEGRIWQELLTLLERHPQAPIYHFCPFEPQTIQRLGQKYGTTPARIQTIRQRCVDLHTRLVRSVVLPVENYTLKAIARWLGFGWQHPRADGAQCTQWYNQWLQTQDHSYLQALQRYNQDDCYATYHLYCWLVDFMRHQQATPAVSRSTG